MGREVYELGLDELLERAADELEALDEHDTRSEAWRDGRARLIATLRDRSEEIRPIAESLNRARSFGATLIDTIVGRGGR